LQATAGERSATIDNDRACYILGETWQGAAKGASDAIFLSVGTGIGAGILKYKGYFLSRELCKQRKRYI
jgi:glucokinase